MRTCAEHCALRRGPDTAPATATSRRDFVAATLLASVGAFLAACGDGNIGGITGSEGGSNVPPPPGGTLVVVLANFPELSTDGGIARVDGSSAVPIAVTRVTATTYLAFSMICPHASYRPIDIVAGVGFECPNHGSQFDAFGGRTRGPTRNDLSAYAVVLNAGAGTLSIG